MPRRLPSSLKITLLASPLVVWGAGCQAINSPPRDEEPVFSTAPLPIDAATQYRDWEPTAVVYPNGGVVAGPTLFAYEPDAEMSPALQGLVAPFLFLGQTIALPVTAILTPPWSEVTYDGVEFEPTYTAVPPLPLARDGGASLQTDIDGVDTMTIDGQNYSPTETGTVEPVRTDPASTVSPPPDFDREPTSVPPPPPGDRGAAAREGARQTSQPPRPMPAGTGPETGDVVRDSVERVNQPAQQPPAMNK